MLRLSMRPSREPQKSSHKPQREKRIPWNTVQRSLVSHIQYLLFDVRVTIYSRVRQSERAEPEARINYERLENGYRLTQIQVEPPIQRLKGRILITLVRSFIWNLSYRGPSMQLYRNDAVNQRITRHTSPPMIHIIYRHTSYSLSWAASL